MPWWGVLIEDMHFQGDMLTRIAPLLKGDGTRTSATDVQSLSQHFTNPPRATRWELSCEAIAYVG